MQADLFPYRLPLVSPIATGSSVIADRRGVLVRLRADGVEGWGDAAPLPGWPGGDYDEVEAALRAWVDVPDADLSSAPIAAAAVDVALADLGARRSDRPLAAALADHPAESVPVNALIVETDPAGAAAGAVDAVAQGYTTLKLKVGAHPIADDARRMRAVRAAVGDDIALRIDANRGWSVGDAREGLAVAVDVDVEYVEEPTADPVDWEELRRYFPVPIAVDESGADPTAAAALIDGGAVDVVIVKLPPLGGVTSALALAARARAAGLGVVVTSFLDNAVGLHAALHVAGALGPDQPAAGLATAAVLARDVGPMPVITAGRIAVPTTPGLGFAPDVSVLRK